MTVPITRSCDLFSIMRKLRAKCLRNRTVRIAKRQCWWLNLARIKHSRRCADICFAQRSTFTLAIRSCLRARARRFSSFARMIRRLLDKSCDARDVVCLAKQTSRERCSHVGIARYLTEIGAGIGCSAPVLGTFDAVALDAVFMPHGCGWSYAVGEESGSRVAVYACSLRRNTFT